MLCIADSTILHNTFFLLIFSLFRLVYLAINHKGTFINHVNQQKRGGGAEKFPEKCHSYDPSLLCLSIMTPYSLIMWGEGVRGSLMTFLLQKKKNQSPVLVLLRLYKLFGLHYRGWILPCPSHIAVKYSSLWSKFT